MRLLFNNKICKIWETLPNIVHGVYDRRMLRFKETQYCLWKTNFACRHLRHIQNDKYSQWHAASIKTAYNIVDCGRINCGKEESHIYFVTIWVDVHLTQRQQDRTEDVRTPYQNHILPQPMPLICWMYLRNLHWIFFSDSLKHLLYYICRLINTINDIYAQQMDYRCFGEVRTFSGMFELHKLFLLIHCSFLSQE
jgi:hypothetical protein